MVWSKEVMASRWSPSVCKCKSLVVMGIPVPGIDLEQHLKDMDCSFGPVDLFQGESFVIKRLSAPLVQADGIVEGIDRILVPSQIEEGRARI